LVTAIVLSGGGAHGDFEVGALKFLYQKGIRPNIVCGTSVGAINGVKLAEGEWYSGRRTDYSWGLVGLEKIWRSLRFNTDMWREESWLKDIPTLKQAIAEQGPPPKQMNFPLVVRALNQLANALAGIISCPGLCIELGKLKDAFAKNPPPRSVYNLEPIRQKLSNPALLQPNEVSNSGIKLRLATVSLESGELRYVTEKGRVIAKNPITGVQGDFTGGQPVSLVDGVLASADIPGIFLPIKLNIENYVDGGIRDQVPIQAAIDAGANEIYVILASKTSMDPKSSFDGKNIIDIAERGIMDIMTNETLQNDVYPPPSYGWGTMIKAVIKPNLEVHDFLNIDTGLIGMTIDYGYMVAFDTIQGSSQNQQRSKDLSDIICTTRKGIWDAEGRANNSGNALLRQPDPESNDMTNYDIKSMCLAINEARQKKRYLRDLIMERIGYGGNVPDNIRDYIFNWEGHFWTPGQNIDLFSIPPSPPLSPWDRWVITHPINGDQIVLWEAETKPAYTPRIMIADFSTGKLPLQIKYWENWGQANVLDGWTDAGDLQLVGDFMGLKHDQILFINTNPQGGRIMIADFSTGKPPAQVRYWENWGQDNILDGWIEKFIYQGGNFAALGHDQLFLSHWT